MAARGRRQRKLEETAHQRKLDAIAIKPREDLVKAQAEELRNVGQKLHGWRVEARRKQGKALDVLKQKFRNLETDQSHAHAIMAGVNPASFCAFTSQRDAPSTSLITCGSLACSAAK